MVAPKGFYHYVIHVPDMIRHLTHHHHDHGDHHEDHTPATKPDNSEDHHQHDDLPFNHDHSSDGKSIQVLTLFHHQPIITFAVLGGNNTTVASMLSLFNSEFVPKIWLPPKVC